MRVVLVIVFVCWVVGRLCAEIPDFDYVQASERIVDLLSEDDAVVDYEALYDMLFRLSQQPVNLGSPHADELDKLFFLSELQRENLAYYLYRTGGMRSMYELQLVPGIDRFMVGLLRPFVVVSPSDSPYHKALPDFSNALTRADHQIDMRVMRRFDFSNVGALSKNSFGVLPYDFMLRYRFNVPNRLWVNISALHDAGEPFWNRYQRGFEAYHVALEYRGQKWLERFVVGDYRVGFGQGLLFGSSFRSGVSGAMLPTATGQSGVRHLTSLSESDYLRGVAVKLRYKQAYLSLLYSFQLLDADTAAHSFQAFKTDGLFCSPTDYAKRHTVARHVVGTHLGVEWHTLVLGATLYSGWLNRALIPRQVARFHNLFSGKWQGALSVDYYFRYRYVTAWGETALSHRGAVASVLGVSVELASRLFLTLLVRYYAPHYDLFLAQGFAQHSGTTNETGCYVAVQYMPLSFWSVTGYLDLYRALSPTPAAAIAAVGTDLFMLNRFTLGSDMQLHFRGRFQCKELLLPVEKPTPEVGFEKLYQMRCDLAYALLPWSFMSGIHFNAYGRTRSSHVVGMLLMQQLAWSSPGRVFHVWLRILLFDAPSYELRFYRQEQNIPTLYAITPFYGSGCRYYLMAQVRPLRDLTLAIRFAQTYAVLPSAASGSPFRSKRQTDLSFYVLWNMAFKRD